MLGTCSVGHGHRCHRYHMHRGVTGHTGVSHRCHTHIRHTHTHISHTESQKSVSGECPLVMIQPNPCPGRSR